MNYQSAFFIYYSKIYLKCVFCLVYPFSLRFIACGLLDKQNLRDSDSAGSVRWLFTSRLASIILKTKNNNKNRKNHFEPFKFRFYNTEGKMFLKLSRNFIKQSVKHSSRTQTNQQIIEFFRSVQNKQNRREQFPLYTCN